MTGPGSHHALATYRVLVLASCSPALATAERTTLLIRTAERCLLKRSSVNASSTSRPLIRFITSLALRGEMRANRWIALNGIALPQSSAREPSGSAAGRLASALLTRRRCVLLGAAVPAERSRRRELA